MMFAEAAIKAAAKEAKSNFIEIVLFPEQMTPPTRTEKKVIAALSGRMIFKTFIEI
jgi:hypothetical protein